VNNLIVINTCYEKMGIYNNTWQHPGSKMRHYKDVSVIQRADCRTDPKLLSAKIVLRHNPLVAQQHIRRRFAGCKLRYLSASITLMRKLLIELVQFGVMICLLKRCGVLYVHI